jgi:type II secretion system protein N
VRTIAVSASQLPQKGEGTVFALKAAGACLAILVVLLLIALWIVKPYARLEQFASDALKRHAPAGTVAGGVDIGFPFNVAITNLTVPIQVHDESRDLLVKEVTGKVSVLSFLQGKVQAGMNADFFGGLLWLDLDVDGPVSGATGIPTRVEFDARARSLNISELCTFFEAPVTILGLCDADVEGKVHENDARTLTGKATVVGREMEIPPLAIDKLILPESTQASFVAELSAGRNQVFIDSFSLDGTAYKLAGSGTVQIANPPDRSSLDCTFSAVFKEPPIVTDEELERKGAEYVLDTLVSTHSEVFFKLTGTLQKPQVELDSRSSIGALIEQLKR